jgi:uncharacterized surface protein with fasciclin (FAS1) repeats
MSNITQVVNTEKNMTTLKKSVHASGLDQVLSSTGPYTLFAPSDLAFEKLDKSVLENLLKPESITRLKNLINSHIVSGKINYKDLKDGERLKTVNGGELQVHIKDNKVHIEGSLIQNRDVKTSNGVIHSLDTVVIKN